MEENATQNPAVLVPTVGRIMLYTYAEHDGVKAHVVGETRPCIVVRSFGGPSVNVQVFTDGSNDFEDGRRLHWATSVSTVPAKPSPEPQQPGAITWPTRS